MTVQNRQAPTPFRSQTGEGKLPLDKDSKKNLESRRVVDLLPDREAETSAAWMRQQLDLMVISRDRGGADVSAAREGAPQATQCADRFHLMVRRIGAYSIPFAERRG